MRTPTTFVCPLCGATATYADGHGAVICFDCETWPAMQPRVTRVPDPRLVSDEVPARLRPLARMMSTNGEVRA
jgi:hypothetical protein